MVLEKHRCSEVAKADFATIASWVPAHFPDYCDRFEGSSSSRPTDLLAVLTSPGPVQLCSCACWTRAGEGVFEKVG